MIVCKSKKPWKIWDSLLEYYLEKLKFFFGKNYDDIFTKNTKKKKHKIIKLKKPGNKTTTKYSVYI